MKKSILFIINPISGGKDKKHFPSVAERYLDKDKFTPRFVFTARSGHAYELALKAVEEGTDFIIAVGGDGTVNEIASAVQGSRSAMGIIPCGSGNGLALSLNIPLNHRKAIERVNLLRISPIDTGILNGSYFFNMAGIGFDAHISHKFSNMTSRGFLGYVKTAFSEIVKYKSGSYRIEVDGKNYDRTAFMISIANSPQYGNNAFISPTALLNDGILDVCIVKPFPLALFPAVVLRMFTKTSQYSKYLEIIKGRNIRIVSYDHTRIHLDGEPGEAGKEISISVKPSSLSVLY
ncbi:diacylglycerol/lipid kinase family protein [Arcticibacter tournemirensis]|uniref:Diacylglycerol kinase family lipid kinase n=1 Tax=Arcticibacter tournemirensis TaxID=699437 RepID=A0A4Q0ME06_9SPHI|nr:diacylglycerol kinase family protein [Arcticibacter tournemirensis]RXF71658.1 diacylglycerol kinase family lipid kinase [Arcticibacter tournemirensis]